MIFAFDGRERGMITIHTDDSYPESVPLWTVRFYNYYDLGEEEVIDSFTRPHITRTVTVIQAFVISAYIVIRRLRPEIIPALAQLDAHFYNRLDAIPKTTR
ncbi:unnamed protein product, partial [Hymenolepis diminuta]